MRLAIPRLSRRTLLGASSLGFGAIPLVRALGTALATEPASVLTNLIGVYTPHGVAREWFRPREGFDIAYDGSVLRAFDDPTAFGVSFRDRILVLEGVDLTAGIQGASAGHEGSRVLLTGSGRDGRNASLDQFLANEIGLGALTPIPSVVLGVGIEEAAASVTMSFAEGGVPLPKIIDPSAAFHELIGQWVVGDDPAELARVEHERRLGRSVLDTLRADLGGLMNSVSGSERLKLEQHLSALRGLESRLSGFELACASPVAPAPSTFPSVRAYQGGEPHFDTITDLQIDLLALALSCGVTRFATLYLADLSRTGLDSSLPEDVHIDVAHRYRPVTDTSPGDAQISRLLANQNRYVYGKVARLVSRLSEAGVLEDTLVMAVSDMGDPARHDSRNVPILLAGGESAGLLLGRHVDAHVDGVGQPNNRLLVSIARAFGLELRSFGEARDPTTTEGELDGLV